MLIWANAHYFLFFLLCLVAAGLTFCCLLTFEGTTQFLVKSFLGCWNDRYLLRLYHAGVISAEEYKRIDKLLQKGMA